MMNHSKKKNKKANQEGKKKRTMNARFTHGYSQCTLVNPNFSAKNHSTVHHSADST